MPEHPITFENLIDWLEERLDDETHQKVAAHLGAGCPQCQAELALLRRILAAGRAPALSTDAAFDPPTKLVAQAKRLYRSPQPAAASSTRSGRVAWPFRRGYAFAAVFIAALVGLAWFIRTPMPVARSAVVTFEGGQVETQSGESGPWTAEERTRDLPESAALRASSGPATVTLFENSSLALQPGAEIRLMTLRSGLRGSPYRILIEQEGGSVDYDVATLRGKASTFEVRLPSVQATVSVVGTRFGIAIDLAGVAHIQVAEGFVQVATNSDRLVLQTGEEVTVGKAGGLAMLLPSPPCSERAPTPEGSEATIQQAMVRSSMVPEPQVAERVAQIVLATVTPTVEIPVNPLAAEMTRTPVIYPEPPTSAPDVGPTSTIAPTDTAAPPAMAQPVFVEDSSEEEPSPTCTSLPSPTELPTAEPSATQAPSATTMSSPQPSTTPEPSSTATPSRTPRPNPSPPSQLDWEGLTVLHGSLKEVAWDHVMLEATPDAQDEIRVDYDDETYVWGELEEDLDALVIAKRLESAWQAVVIIARGKEFDWPLDSWQELGPMEWPSWFWPSMGHPAGSLGAHSP